jgi:hypothetical protein
MRSRWSVRDGDAEMAGLVVVGEIHGRLGGLGDEEGKKIWLCLGRRNRTATNRIAKGLEVVRLLVENARIARCRKWSVAQFRGSFREWMTQPVGWAEYKSCRYI